MYFEARTGLATLTRSFLVTDPFNPTRIESLAGELRSLSTQALDAGYKLYGQAIANQAELLIAESPFHRVLPQPVSDGEAIATGIVALHGTELAGRRRLQCLAYLLHRTGADFDLRFDYEEGPFSAALAHGLDDALAVRLIDREQRPGRHGISHSYFTTLAPKPASIGKLPADRVSEILEQAKPFSGPVLEIAAAIVMLHDDWWYYGRDRIGAVDEVRRRKPLTANRERIDRALSLLRQLSLDPASNPRRPERQARALATSS